MKSICRYTLFVFCSLLLLSACGYRNPYVYNGPAKTVYITDWKNRTSELGLNTKLYQELVRWFQKSGSISVSKEKTGADLILAGEIISIHFPSRSYGSARLAVEGKMHLRVRYILKDLKTDKVLIEETDHLLSEDYLISTDAADSRSNQQEAIKKALEDLAQKVYQRTLVELPKL